jgi:hypothetical protein
MPDGMPLPMYLAFLEHQEREAKELKKAQAKRKGKRH